MGVERLASSLLGQRHCWDWVLRPEVRKNDPKPRSDTDPVTGFVGSLASEDTLKLATAGWTAGIEAEGHSKRSLKRARAPLVSRN